MVSNVLVAQSASGIPYRQGVAGSNPGAGAFIFFIEY